MNLSDCSLTIDGKEFKATNVRIEFRDNNLKADVEAFHLQDEVYNHPNCKSNFCLEEAHMSDIKELPKNLERFINENYKALYKLNWVDYNLNLTSYGREALGDFLLSKFEDEFGKFAQEELAKKLQEVEEEDEE